MRRRHTQRLHPMHCVALGVALLVAMPVALTCPSMAATPDPATATTHCAAMALDTDMDAYLRSIARERSAVDVFGLLMRRDHAEELETRLARGVDPNVCGGFLQRGLLATAASLGLGDDVERLLEHGAQLESPLAANGESPLIDAVANSRYAIAKRLMRAGADVQRRYAFADTALHALALSTRSAGVYDADAEAALAHDLIRAGLSADARDTHPKFGFTPLHWAAFHDKPALVRCLLDEGANATLTDARGRRAIDLAKSSEIQRMLRESTPHTKAAK